jgi:superfamily II DNA or RNA helicase
MNESKKIPIKILESLSNDSRRNAIIIDKLTKILSEGKKILFFATSINHSKIISSLINLVGYSAAHLDGESGSSRSLIINNFRNGDIKLISNFGVLTTGFDDPKIDVVFLARPTNSIVLYSQIIGRGLRGPKIGGTDVCEVYTVNDNIVDLPTNNEIYTYFEEYFVNYNAL